MDSFINDLMMLLGWVASLTSVLVGGEGAMLLLENYRNWQKSRQRRHWGCAVPNNVLLR